MTSGSVSLALVRQRYTADGGAERFVARALEALQGAELSLTLITREWSGGQGFNVQACNPFYLGRLWRDWSFSRAVCRLASERKFDLVQSHERIACCDLYRAGDGVHREWLRQLARARGLVGRLGIALNPYHHYVRQAEAQLFESPRLKAVICNSRMVRDEILLNFAIAPEKLHVIYSGVDVDSFHPDVRRHRNDTRSRFGIPESANVFLFVGSGFERKGVRVLIEAMESLPEDTYLVVVGRDKKARRYAAYAKALGLERRVVFAGSQPDVKPFYGAADALVLPTLYDPFPNVALEALACGLPVITSHKCGAAEIIRDGLNGYVCDALDTPALVAHMQKLCDVGARSRLSAEARATVESWSLARMSEQLVTLYRQLLATR